MDNTFSPTLDPVEVELVSWAKEHLKMDEFFGFMKGMKKYHDLSVARRSVDHSTKAVFEKRVAQELGDRDIDSGIFQSIRNAWSAADQHEQTRHREKSEYYHRALGDKSVYPSDQEIYDMWNSVGQKTDPVAKHYNITIVTVNNAITRVIKAKQEIPENSG